MNKKILILFLICLPFVWIFPVHGSETIEKIGECPPGWSTSGKYCIPGKYAKYIIEKKGECPVGWHTAGKYCVNSKGK